MASVELQQVVKSYDGKNNVIHGIDLHIEHGEFVVFVGPSGCGKSTLLRMIAGLELISGGDVIIDGKRVNDEPPRNPTLDNYVAAFTDQPLLRFLANSAAVAALSTILTLLVSSLAAYAIARLNLRYRQWILTAIVASSMFPLITLLVPIFETMRSLGLLNTYTALVLPYTVLSLPVCTLVLVSFFQSIPRDLENAAMIDGCTRLGALWRVVVPLAAPGVFTAGILSFVNAWDEFLLALSLSSSPLMRTLPVGITLYQTEFVFPWPVISAALVVAIVPIAVLIAIFQERVVSGLTQGGIKG